MPFPISVCAMMNCGFPLSRRLAKFGMSRRFRMQLPEAFDFRHRQIVAAHVQPGVEEHAAVPGGENEDIAIDPTRLVGIVSERVPKKHRADLRAAERKAKMPRLRGLYSVHAQTARLISCSRKYFGVQTHGRLIIAAKSFVIRISFSK